MNSICYFQIEDVRPHARDQVQAQPCGQVRDCPPLGKAQRNCYQGKTRKGKERKKFAI